MRRSMLFAQTLREKPANADTAGHQLLLRAGFIRPLAAGIFSMLPLGVKVTSKIEAILREEMDAIGGQEVSLPIVQPADLWQQSGRWHEYGAELVRFRDRGERDMVLGMTHEEIVTDLLRGQVRSYRQLPVMLYQIQTKFRDEPRARGGLIRVREFTMKDAYSCHADAKDLDGYYPRVYQAYLNVFRCAGIDAIAVESDVGMMGGTMAHEFTFLSEIGEGQIVICDGCAYRANRQIATFRKDLPPAEPELPLEEVLTPETQTIAALTQLLDVSEAKTAKAAFFMAGDRLIFAVIRGDMEVNETKLANAVGAPELRPARADELAAAGIVPGYASPIGVTGTTVVVDDLVAASTNLIAGANRDGFHIRNTNVPRDYRPDVIADIAAADEGAACPSCGSPVRLARGVEVGNIFKLGTRYSHAMGATYVDESGETQEMVMGCYGLGVERLMACIAEANRDERGLIWPVTVAPYAVYLVALDLDDEDVRAAAEDLYARLQAAGIDVLYDDRRERAGVKFNDADLMGMPIRLTISRRTVHIRSVEIRPRTAGDSTIVSLEGAEDCIRAEIGRLETEIPGSVRTEPPLLSDDG